MTSWSCVGLDLTSCTANLLCSRTCFRISWGNLQRKLFTQIQLVCSPERETKYSHWGGKPEVVFVYSSTSCPIAKSTVNTFISLIGMIHVLCLSHLHYLWPQWKAVPDSGMHEMVLGLNLIHNEWIETQCNFKCNLHCHWNCILKVSWACVTLHV